MRGMLVLAQPVRRACKTDVLIAKGSCAKPGDATERGEGHILIAGKEAVWVEGNGRGGATVLAGNM
jgi:hypothetical protein